jgi:5'-nucleotidase
MQYGCCHQVDGCQDKDRFVGAGYKYLTANVVNSSTNSTLFPPYMIREIEGIPVAFIGVSLKDTPAIVAPSAVRGLTFLDEADSINVVVRELKEKGIKTIIVLIHCLPRNIPGRSRLIPQWWARHGKKQKPEGLHLCSPQPIQ